MSAAEWAEQLDVFDRRCAYCGTRSDDLTMDHVIALARGGAHSIENVVPACLECNRQKWAHGPLAMVNRNFAQRAA